MTDPAPRPRQGLLGRLRPRRRWVLVVPVVGALVTLAFGPDSSSTDALLFLFLPAVLWIAVRSCSCWLRRSSP